MTTTIPPAEPISGDLSPERIADLIDAAAQLIERDGLEVGGYWVDSLFRPYEPGARCCTVGALAVVCGYRSTHEVEDTFTATSCVDPNDVGDTWTPHPVFAAAMDALGFKQPEHLYDWSDSTPDREVVEDLREAATAIRTRGGAA